jgi:hypothetical protein
MGVSVFERVKAKLEDLKARVAHSASGGREGLKR